MTIRVATSEDYNQLLEMLLKFAASSTYSHLYKEEVISDWLKICLDKPITESIFLVGDGGCLLGSMSQLFGTDVKTAAEIVWWVDPSKRKNGLGTELRDAFEYWAKANGAKVITSGYPRTENGKMEKLIDKYLKKRGYVLQEYTYMKEI